MSERTRPPIPDPRPHVAAEGGAHVIAGFACTGCGHPLEVAGPWCPECRSELEPRAYGPGGTVWSSTVFRVPLPGRRPPWVLAWVDLDDGPRILAHVEGRDERPRVGSRVEIVGVTDEGDPLVRRTGAGSEGRAS